MNNLISKEIDITVAIPTFNGEKRLPIILEKILNQTGLDNLNWEIIVVDNNSSDNTLEIIKKYQENYSSHLPLRYILESKQGAAFARITAVREAKGKLVAFLDDDNLPAADWLISAYEFAKLHPQAGAWSGQIHGNYEVEPPEEFEKIQAFLAIREHGDKPFLFDANNLRLPPGAALVVRKQAWCENVPSQPILTGKLPGLLVQGDDYEPLLYIHFGGWQIWYNPEMHTYHQIPKWRFEVEYLKSLARGCGLCICQLRLINAGKWQKPLILAKTFLGNLRRLIQHYLKYRSELKGNTIANFEIEFYRGSMMSPMLSLNYYMTNFLGKFFDKKGLQS
jgi:glycosyltransferase involved in cell wall biosynthesis